jgi:ATP-dependent Clp protease ATP-binding subunit ClpC
MIWSKVSYAERPVRFEHFSEDARAVLTQAQAEAIRLHHSYLETEHMLLGISAKASKRTSDALEYLGVSLDKIKSATESVIGPVGKGHIKQDVDLGPRAKRAIEFAVDEARRLNSNYIGSEHFLLGLLRESDGVAASILESLGLTVQRFREALQKKDFSA